MLQQVKVESKVNKIKVLVVDDSAVIRQVMGDIINADPELELIAAVVDPLFAMKRMEMVWPDVIILDVEMPRMDGITFLRKIMSEHPTPVVMCSTLTVEGSETAMQALSAGALEIIEKPKIAAKAKLKEKNRKIIDAIKTAAKAKNLSQLNAFTNKLANNVLSRTDTKQSAKKLTADAMLDKPTGALSVTTDGIVAIGTSTGGTQALEAILTSLPRTSPGIVVVQHMPVNFTKAFADRLNTICEVQVKEANDKDKVLPGKVLIAPGGMHMALKRSGSQYIVEVKDGPLVNRHRPSVDVLFRSVAKFAGKNALGVIMTGMGDDGARGMLEMHECGVQTLAQNEETCIVYGMPKEAVKLGGVDEQVGLDKVAQKIMNFYMKKNKQN
jgi:two-component system chemotaxis response regulator CheB